jgi:DNA-binding NtrC family response regulator
MPNIQKFETVPLSEVPLTGGVSSMGNDQNLAPVVLVVDEEEIVANTRAAILRNWGYSVSTAYCASVALEIARDRRPQYFLCDAELTSISGVKLATEIQSIVADCQILLSASDADSLALLATARNARSQYTLLQKPVHPDQLRSFFPTPVAYA